MSEHFVLVYCARRLDSETLNHLRTFFKTETLTKVLVTSHVEVVTKLPNSIINHKQVVYYIVKMVKWLIETAD